jgi:large subunit ribosomal protein L41
LLALVFEQALVFFLTSTLNYSFSQRKKFCLLQLKPYVSYRTPDVVQSEFTSSDLFDAVYSEKIVKDFKDGKLSETGEPLEPSQEELLTPEEAYNRARKTGTDIF